MRPKLTISLAIVALAALPVLLGLAMAQDAPAGGNSGTDVDLPFLIAPMNDADGNLQSYAYISSRLTARSRVFALDARNKLAFVQDAFVRDVNHADITKTGDPGTVDKAALGARLLADARRVLGAGEVASIVIVDVQVSPLRPIAGVTPGATPVTAAQPPVAATPVKSAPSGG